MDQLYVLIRLRNAHSRRAIRKHRATLLELRLRSSPFDLPDFRFKKLFRLNKSLVRSVISKLQNYSEIASIPFKIQVLTALHFYAHGSYQISIGSNHLLGLSQPSVSRVVEHFTCLVNRHLREELIQFPHNALKKAEIKEGFYRKFNMPSIIGAIDGCHVPIIAPPESDDYLRGNVYRNRKGYYSINVLVCCDSHMRITYADCRYPGSVHDSAIWLMAPIRRHLRRLFSRVENQSCFLIGDSGFPLEPWLLTPFLTTSEGTLEHTYNGKFLKARNTIERCFGVIKSRFRCLSRHRVLHYDPATAAGIIYAVFTLHNMCINDHTYVSEDINVHMDNENEINLENENDSQETRQMHTLGLQARQLYMQNFN